MVKDLLTINLTESDFAIMSTELQKRLWQPVWDADVATVSAILKEENITDLDFPHEGVAANVTVGLLEVLVTHGYDINRAGRPMPSDQSRTLIDYPKVLKKEQVVHWLVEHGAKLDRGQREYNVMPMPPPLLDAAAVNACVSTFKYLRQQGAMLGRRTLHLAVGYAAGIQANPDAPEDWKGYIIKGGDDRRRVNEMLMYLVDELKLDVNADDWARQDISRPTGHYGTPLSYAAGHRMGSNVVKWLLSKGADPHLKGDPALDARRTAMSTNSEKVVEVLNDWERTHESTSSTA